MTTNKSGSVNQQPLYVCTGCIGSYEDCTWLAGDLHVHDGECWCDPCWYMRRFEFPDLPEWEDLEPYTPALQAEHEKLVSYTQNSEQGGEWVRCDERLPTEADSDALGFVWTFSKGLGVTVLDRHSFTAPPFYTHWKPTGLTRPQPPKSKEGDA